VVVLSRYGIEGCASLVVSSVPLKDAGDFGMSSASHSNSGG
jgi:hypothetical protein